MAWDMAIAGKAGWGTDETIHTNNWSAILTIWSIWPNMDRGLTIVNIVPIGFGKLTIDTLLGEHTGAGDLVLLEKALGFT